MILATDMARHAEILDAFKLKIDSFDYSLEDHVNTLKMILIKACDISNECRPLLVRRNFFFIYIYASSSYLYALTNAYFIFEWKR